MRASCRLVPLLALLAPTVLGCIHLVQPQTYYLDTERVNLQQQEYIWKELIAGLPEPLFRRWYTRTDDWKDSLRPYILEQYEEDGQTVYKVGSGSRTIERVYFKDGSLEKLGEWGLTQEAFLSAWLFKEHPPQNKLKEGMLERIEALDPPSDVLILDEHSRDGHVCEFEAGMELEAMAPLFLHYCGPPTRCLTKNEVLAIDQENGPVLPAGAKLVVERRGVGVGRVRARGNPDMTYHVELSGANHGLCPAGACPRIGAVALLSRDLTVVRDEFGHDPGNRPFAFAAGQTRIPVWAERLGVVPAGTRVRILEWFPCQPLFHSIPVAPSAVVEVLDPLAIPVPGPLRVLFAPPGFFEPVEGEGVSVSAQSLIK